MPSARGCRRKPIARGALSVQNRVNLLVPVDVKPPRGMKLKTVSSLTLGFALCCLAALAAGRPPARAGSSPAGDKEIHVLLGLQTAVLSDAP